METYSDILETSIDKVTRLHLEFARANRHGTPNSARMIQFVGIICSFHRFRVAER